jgi:sugar phosphate isomerase/epimerase
MSDGRPRTVVCLCSAAFGDQPIESVIQHAAQMGYDGIDIAAPHLAGKRWKELAVVRHVARDSHVRVCMVSPGFWLTRDLPEQFERSLSTAGFSVVVAHALAGPGGPPMIRVVLDAGSGSIGSAEATGEHWERATSALRRITALDPGLVFGVETRAQTLADTPQSTLKLLATVGAANLAVSYLPGEGEPVAGWRLLRSMIRNLHFDYPPGDGRAGYIEAGGQRSSELLTVLRLDGYAGTISVGLGRTGVTWERAASVRAVLREQGF